MMNRRKNVEVGPENAQIPKRNNAAAKEVVKSDGNPKRQRVGLTDLSNAITTTLRIDGDQEQEVKDQKPRVVHKVKEEVQEDVLDEEFHQIGQQVRDEEKVKEEEVNADESMPIQEVLMENGQVVAAGPMNLATDYDYDATCMADLFTVAEYAHDIFRYYVSREPMFRTSDYLRFHPALTKLARATAVNWMVRLQEEYELNHEVLYHGVKIFDLFLSRTKKFTHCNFIAATALIIATKIDIQDPMSIEELHLFDRYEDRVDVFCELEKRILNKLNFDLNMPLSYRFLRRYSRAGGLTLPTLTLARYILETTLIFYEFVCVPDSVLAAASLLLALKMIGSETWNARLIKYTGYTEMRIEPLAWRLNHMMLLREAVYPNARAIEEKYGHEVFFHAAEVPLLPDRRPLDEPIGPPEEFKVYRDQGV